MKNGSNNKFSSTLKDKVVVITGASSGVGKAAALAFAKEGAKLVLAARGGKALNQTEAECRELGCVALAVPTDVTDANEVKQLADTAYNFGNCIDVWVNNAGVLAAGPFEETPVDIHDQVIKTNLLGYIHGAHAVIPYFKEQRQGVLINNISVGGWFPTPYAVGYSASKFGLRGFSGALKGELSSYRHIHVCDLYPAFLDTPGMQHAANYTGSYLKPAPPVYDPRSVARAMVALAKKPRRSATVGSVSTLLKYAYKLAPGFTRFITSKVMGVYFDHSMPMPASEGNVYKPVEYGTSIYGGWNSTADAEKRKEVLSQALLISGVAGLTYWLLKK